MAILKNPRHEAFAQQYARNGNATKSYIAAGYGEKGAAQSAERLLRNADVCSRVKALKQIISDGVVKLAITERSNRVSILDDILTRYRALIEARALDMADVAGGKTGLLVRQLKQVGSGRDAQIVEEYAADTAVTREMRAAMQQAAQELGQWQEKADPNAVAPPPFVVEVVNDAAEPPSK